MSTVLRSRERWLVRPVPSREPLYRSVTSLALVVMRAMDWRVSMGGDEHIPSEGPAIIASNHLSHLDFIFLGLAAYRRHRFVRFMAIRSAFEHRVSGPLLRGMHHIPVDRRNEPSGALDTAVEMLQHGEIVGLHPEGRIRQSETRLPGKTGAVRMALETGAPLIPAAVWGTQSFIQAGDRPRFPRHVAIEVGLGQALELDPRASLADSTERLQERIAELETTIAGCRRTL